MTSTRSTRSLAFVALALFAAHEAMAAKKADHHVRFTPETAVFGNFPIQKAPVLTIKSGETVQIDNGGGAGWRSENLTPDEYLKKHGIGIDASHPVVRESIEAFEKAPRYGGIQTGHFMVGPINVEGAEPGDTLEIRILSVVTRLPYGTTGAMPGRTLRGNGEGPRIPAKVTRLDLKRKVALFSPGIELPLHPFNGVMALQPPKEDGDNRSSNPPGRFGGNLDYAELTDGSILYLPVFHPGGRFFTGDSHAAQGDGEISGTAIETANTLTAQFILHKGRTIDMPRAETPTHYVAFGLDPDLEPAMQQCVDETIEYINDITGWTDTALTWPLMSQIVDFEITQVVDITKGIHSKIPKAIFKQKPPGWWARPGAH